MNKSKGIGILAVAVAALVLANTPVQATVDASGHFSRAQTAWAEGDSDLALSEYQAVINLLGDDAAARHNRALILLATDRAFDALTEAARAVELAPDNGRFHLTLAVAMMAQKKPDLKAARGQLETAVRILWADDDAGGLVRAYFNLGMIAQQGRHFPEARTWYRKALGQDPNDEATLAAMESLEGAKD